MPQALIKNKDSLVINFLGGITKKIQNPELIKIVIEAIKNNASDIQLLELIDPIYKIKTHASGLFGVSDGVVYIDNEAIPDALSARIIDFTDNGLPFEPLIKFWKNCKLNPDPMAKTDLYKFLEHNGHPITTDGFFIGYRAIRSDFKDKYTGIIDNSVGKLVAMDRSMVNSDPNQTCSTGLHVASYDYARNSYGTFGIENGDILVEVKVNPKFVVCVPIDYNSQKMRVCEYTVIAINTDGVIQRPLYDVHSYDGDHTHFDDEDEDDIYGANKSNDDDDDIDNLEAFDTTQNWKSQRRDSQGRFIK